MSVTSPTTPAMKTVADPSDAYLSLLPLWVRCRAVCRGERFVKDYDAIIDCVYYNNFLIPFSPTMTQEQYNFFRAEAELPGISAQFSKVLVGGLLRKQPTITLPPAVPKDAIKWLLNEFGKDNSPLSAFLDEALSEEVQTSCAWVFVDYPRTSDRELTPEEKAKIKPYPILYQAESIINTRTRTDMYGMTVLDRVVVAGWIEEYDDDLFEFHPKLTEVRWVHELNDQGNYQVRTYHAKANVASTTTSGGDRQVQVVRPTQIFELFDISEVMINGEPVKMVPAWPLNGNIDRNEPILTAVVDKEVALYNKLSRRNHLLLGAATYTPVISSDMSDDEFQKVVDSGLGTWINLPSEGKADILKTPTEALADYDRAIAASYEEIARLGVRMLAPEKGPQSGVALEIKNAAQTAQMGSLNMKISNTMKQVVTYMINWRYGLDVDAADVDFTMSSDFNNTPLGADWMTLATSWYQQGLIPRDIWLLLLKQNDLLPPDYDDKEGQKQINTDELTITPVQKNQQYQDNIANQISSKDQSNLDPSKGK
jgi:hypothetical protein